MRSLRAEILAWHAVGRPFALATVTEAEGSGPRAAGACLIVAAGGAEFFGSVSAGCLDNEVIAACDGALAAGTVRELHFGPEDRAPWRDPLSCGGKVVVRVEPWWGLSQRTETRAVGAAVARCLAEGTEWVVMSRRDEHLALDGGGETVAGDENAFSSELRERALAMLRAGKPSALIGDGGNPGGIFVRTLPRPRRLLIVGAVDIARHLASFAGNCGFAVTIVDPRRYYATKERFPELGAKHTLVCSSPTGYVQGSSLGARDAAVVLTHDPKIDDAALEELLRGRVGYIGALGSRTSHQARLTRLRARGFHDGDLARIEGPAGIRLGGRDPASIALGIMAGIERWKAAAQTV